MRRTAVAVTAIVAAVVVIAVVAERPPELRLGSGDAGVWVINRSEAAIGRVNTQIDELVAMVESPASNSEIVQSGSEIVLVDHDTATATRIDSATARPGGSIALPGRASQLAIAERMPCSPRATDASGSCRSTPSQTLTVIVRTT